VRVVIGDRIVLFGDKMIMNEPKGFYKGHFPWLQRTLRVLVIEPLKKGFCIEPFRGSKYVALIEPFLLRVYPWDPLVP